MPSVFTRIIRGELPAYRIAEDKRYLAFLDIHPQVPGHVLVVPKQEVDLAWDLDDQTLGGWLIFARPIAAALKRATSCTRVAATIVGLDVPHAHLHLLPVIEASQTAPNHRADDASAEALVQMQKKIVAALQGS